MHVVTISGDRRNEHSIWTFSSLMLLNFQMSLVNKNQKFCKDNTY